VVSSAIACLWQLGPQFENRFIRHSHLIVAEEQGNEIVKAQAMFRIRIGFVSEVFVSEVVS